MCKITVPIEFLLLKSGSEEYYAKKFLFTPSFPVIANIFKNADNVDRNWLESLKRVNYLGNICLVLLLNKSLSKTYWLNVNDPGFPFVGVIEHTNFDHPKNYNNKHVVYLSKYLSKDDPIWNYDNEEYYNFAITYLKRMFPKFDESWVDEYDVWRSDYAQPVTEKEYSSYVPNKTTPYENVWISTMAHVYPEDRGTNYAVRDGINISKQMFA